MNKNLPKEFKLTKKEAKKVENVMVAIIKAYIWHILGLVTGFIIIMLWWALK